MSNTIDREASSRTGAASEGSGVVRRRGGGASPGLGLSGVLLGTNGNQRRTFFYALGALTLLLAAINTVNVITIYHEQPGYGVLAPAVWEGTSWLSFVLFSWLPWLVFRLVPPESRPRWRVALVHPIAAVVYSACHVAGFVAMRKLAYWLAGSVYDYGPLQVQFPYELRKDVFGYAVIIAAFWIASRIAALPPPHPAQAPRTYDIRDGAKLTRVRLEDVLAVSSAGNYVEFVLRDGARILMRSPLSALERELHPQGFVRIHRSWLVNAGAVTGLKPEGSGDYTVEIGGFTVPLSRRYPQALAALRRS